MILHNSMGATMINGRDVISRDDERVNISFSYAYIKNALGLLGEYKIISNISLFHDFKAK